MCKEKEKFNSIVTYIEKMAEVHKDDIAVISGDERLSYGELNERAAVIAGNIESFGCESKLVGIFMQRTVNMLAVMVGILKTGKAYVAIDPSYPDERVQIILESSGLDVLIVDEETKDIQVKSVHKINVNEVDKHCDIKEYLVTTGIDKEDLAYLLYTSGSTGVPKGVMIQHQSICNLREAMLDYVPMEPGMHIFSMTRIVFDVFVVESIIALSYGMTIYLTTGKELHNPRLLGRRLKVYPIDMIQMTPSTVRYLASCDESLSCLKNVKYILVAGEAFPINLLVRMRENTNAKIYNFYGPTEATVYSLAGEVTGCHKIVDIGVPLRNFEAYLLDEKMKISDKGELYLGGVGLAKGYWQQEELTKQRFVKMPEISANYLYRTGDLVERLPDGKYHYLRRIDNQVKINGFRIELGEIESVIQSIEGIKEVAVVVRKGKHDNSYLCAFYTQEHNVDENEIRNVILKRLPDYMLPAVFVKRNHFEISQNGKIDRKELETCSIVNIS
ncbi:amino acid adenylation domain-containing protein [[Clostridium] polysaccharolyticum]|uniref:Amino acid adenylation domain-containing protein n=1 Tax=[Clostridium] polysaccharolyticum TaxID=29364 RepID=A0A1I0BE16_9FIRM|nr:amino acid adenylation domain-containing protein [[Clostridium] polysaccharolyticum]SET05102.1 amino acid adenylation domain-containing protein [[Clostridium] polysaccharolyticum]